MSRVRSSAGLTLMLAFATVLVVGFITYAAPAADAGLLQEGPVSADPDAVVTVAATGDSWINQESPGTNYGSDSVLYVGRASGQQGNYNRQTLLQFDLGSVPPGSTITKATLQLFQVAANGAPRFNIYPEAFYDSWSEMGVNWNNRPPASSLGDPPSTLDLVIEAKQWDVTKIVQNWYVGQIKNYGILLRGDGDTLGLHAFGSKEGQSAPQLIIEYRPPPWTSTPTPTNTPAPTRTPTPTATPSTPPVLALPYFPVQHVIALPYLPYDVSIHGIEITQGIQCFDSSNGLTTCPDNSIPVVAQKDTTARIYLKVTGALTSLIHVPVRLYIRANGVWYTADATGRATTALNQADPNSADVYFNVDFANGTLVDIYAVVDPANSLGETNEGNNRYPASGYITLNFRKRDTMNIVGQRLRYHPGGYSGTQYAAGWAVNGGGAQWLEQLLPIRNNGISYSIKSGYLDWTGTLSTGDGQHDLIRRLNLDWVLQNALSWFFGTGAFTGARHVYGWAPSGGYSGGHADMPVYPHAGGLGVVGIGSDAAGSTTDNPGSGAEIFGHELVHDYNVYHTNTSDACGSTDGNSDFPYATSSIQEFGFNPMTGKIYDPVTTQDLMSYCPSGGSKQGWIAPFTWNKMFNDLATTALNAAMADGPESSIGILRTTDSAESLVVNVTVFNPAVAGKPSGALGDLYKISGGIAYDIPSGDYAIELRQGSQVLSQTPFVVNFESEYDGHGGPSVGAEGNEPPFPSTPTEQADLSFIIPWAPGATSVALVHANQVLAQRAASGHEPTVAFTDPLGASSWPAGSEQTLRWQGQDADGDSLSYALLFSHDSGSSWDLLASGLSGTEYPVLVDSLAGTTEARFRVVATDGINIGYAETSGPISIPNKAPMVVISNPAHGSSFTPGALVVFHGSATDLEDGSLFEDKLQWSSDRSGFLGSGGSLPVNTLSPGLHQITVTVEDSEGVASSATVSVFIGQSGYLPLAR